MSKRRRLSRYAREQAHPTSLWQNRWLRVAFVIALIAVAGVIGFQLFALPAPTTSTASSDPHTATCAPVQSQPSQGQLHMTANESRPNYRDTPPTSGSHDSNPLNDGIRSTPMTNVDIARAIHSLEHGRVAIYYNNLDAEQVTKLENAVKSSDPKVILAPWTGLNGKVALTAWTKLQTCDGVDEQPIRDFIKAFRDKGPERVPRGSRWKKAHHNCLRKT